MSGVDRRRARAWHGCITRQALHAAILEFDHPESGERLRFEAPAPADLAELLRLLDV
jgi:23S rRNA pseudouridine1911/1915/1917 synthase